MNDNHFEEIPAAENKAEEVNVVETLKAAYEPEPKKTKKPKKRVSIGAVVLISLLVALITFQMTILESDIFESTLFSF